MTAVINFTPLYGVEQDEPFCFLLTIDNYNILLDCGWNEAFDDSQLTALKKIVPDVDCVLLSHPDVAHLGALPYAVGRLGLTAPIYATLPIYKMGQMFMYDAFMSRAKFKFDVFDLDDVDQTFARINQLKYYQDIALTDKGEGIVVTPYVAGHMVGGTMWKIAKETETIVYAVDYNHTRERHLASTDLQIFERPTVLITDTKNVLRKLEKRGERDKRLFTLVDNTLERGGNVLLPTDAAGRCLELLMLLHDHWTHKETHKKWERNTCTLALLSNVAYNTVEFARSMTEWMSKNCQKKFIRDRDNPFTLRNLHICHSKDELDKLKKPYVVIASSSSLQPSFAQEVFLELSADPNNVVLFTDRADQTTLAGQLQVIPTPRQVTFPRFRNVLLEGAELEEYLQQQQRDAEQKKADQQREAQDADSDSDMEDQDEVTLTGSSARFHSLSKLTPAFPMFPFVEIKRTG